MAGDRPHQGLEQTPKYLGQEVVTTLKRRIVGQHWENYLDLNLKKLKFIQINANM